MSATREYVSKRTNAHVPMSERSDPITTSKVGQMLTTAGEGLGMPIHPHMLRHGCGFKLANQGIDAR